MSLPNRCRSWKPRSSLPFLKCNNHMHNFLLTWKTLINAWWGTHNGCYSSLDHGKQKPVNESFTNRETLIQANCNSGTEAKKYEITFPQTAKEGTIHKETKSSSFKHKTSRPASNSPSIPLSLRLLPGNCWPLSVFFAVLCNPDISIKNLIKAYLMHRDHINGPQLPIVLSQYQRGMDLKNLWTMTSPCITLVVSLIGYYFLHAL